MLPNGEIQFRDLTIGDYSALREYNRNPDFFVKSFLPPNSFSLSSIRNNHNFILIGRKGTGKSSCCLALAHEKGGEGFSAFFYNFSDDLTRAELKDSVQTQSLNLGDISTRKLFDSIVEFYDFRDLWKRRVLYTIAQDLHRSGNSSEFIKFVSSVKLAESSIADGVGRGLQLPIPGEFSNFIKQFDVGKFRSGELPLSRYNEIALSLLRQYHSDYKCFFFFDELNLSHSKSGSDEYETLIALVRDIVRASAEMNDEFVRHRVNIHVICSMRPEVRNEIIRRDNEMSKTIDSNFVGLSWPSQARMDNPLIDLLLKKIAYSHEDIGDPKLLIPSGVFAVAEKKVVSFPVYFLNITWYRPRDAIRVLKCYQVTNGDRSRLFDDRDDQYGFLKEYSRVSRQDIVAELEVKFSRELLTEALQRIRKPVFQNKDDLLDHLDVLSNRLDVEELITDLFDAGVILNHQIVDGEVRVFASYRNDPDLVPDLRIIVHRGLQTSMHMGFKLAWDIESEA